MSTEIEILKRRLEREIQSRKAAETILESKALELYEANVNLQKLNENLEQEVENRSALLVENEKKYRHLIENASDIIFNVDSAGCFTYLNPVGFKEFGYSEEEVLGKNFLTFIHENYREDSEKVFKNMSEENLSSAYKELPILTKNKEIRWMGQNINRIVERDGSYYFSSVARDITARKEAEKELEKARKELVRSELKYRGIMENMELGLMEVDTNGIIIKSYDRFSEMMGYEKDELLGKNAREVFLFPEEEGEITKQEKAREQGETGVYEMKLKKKNGEPIWVLISGAPFYDEKDNYQGSIGIHYDLTERKELQFKLERAQKEASKAQEAEKQFLASMSHEIRTPLNAIIGMNYLLKDTPLNSEQLDYLDVMVSSANLLKHLIAEILDLSKIDSGLLEPNLTEFDLNEVLDEVHKLFKFKNIDSDIRFVKNIKNPLSHLVISDSQFINQVLVNLLGNAEKFTEKGTITMGTELIKENAESFEILFYVKDTGSGIGNEHLDKIFDRFTQENSQIRTKYGGTGLGLPICKEMIEVLEGEIQVESEVGKGSKFYFTLQLKKGSLLKKEDSDFKITTEVKKNKTTGRVLIAEDNPMNCKYIESLFNTWEVSYDMVSDGLAAVESVKKRHYDLILMDLQMPIMDGFEATKIILEYNANVNKNTPIVALTASSFTSNKKKALENGMSNFITKPFSPDQLKDLLQEYLPQSPQVALQKTKPTFSFHKSLDAKYLKENYGKDLKHAEEMFEIFISTIPEYLKEMDAAVNENHAEKSKAILHKIRPTFSFVGISNFSSLSAELEHETDVLSPEMLKSKWDSIKTLLISKMPLIEEQLIQLKKHNSK